MKMMDWILQLAKKYSKSNHINELKLYNVNILEKLNFIYDQVWENQGKNYPYEILTQLLDSYYVLPLRPDLASLFCWQAINHSYNAQQLKDVSKTKCTDSQGIELIQKAISTDWDKKYRIILEPFLLQLPDKTFHYVATYLLKGYAMETAKIPKKYISSSYQTLKKRIPKLAQIISTSYGKTYCKITNPKIKGDAVDLGIKNEEKKKSREIIHSFGMKLEKLMLGNEAEIKLCDTQRTKQKFQFDIKERLTFVLFGILYASRCNNFHGNVASRMNSSTANRGTFIMYTDVYLLEYIILAIHMNSQGQLSDVVLNKIKDNVQLMIKK